MDYGVNFYDGCVDAVGVEGEGCGAYSEAAGRILVDFDIEIKHERSRGYER